MKKFKRFLALSLVLCMVLGFTPANTFAAEDAVPETDTVEAEIPAQDAQILTLTQKPEDGSTKGEPFPEGTGGSKFFRIPGIVTLDNGVMVASADARWNHTGDGAGLDTLVSSSDDNGAAWHYTFANYLGDNGNTKNELSTSFIDPAIATDGKTVYMIADLFPAGIALNTSKHKPVAGHNGLDDQGRLLLRENTLKVSSRNYASQAANASYGFYLDGAVICKLDGTPVEGYTVDDHFNITGEGVDTNLFCADSPFQPYPTNYLYLTTSTDGRTWTAPQLLGLKDTDEQTLLVGPGNGTYDAENGRLIFTAYEYTNGHERTSLIWRDAQGSWHRTMDATTSEKSSEATAVVLADGTVRCFYRGDDAQLEYTDFTWDASAQNYKPTGMEQSFAVTRTINNQMSAILYSKQVDGKDLILLSTAATNTKDRRDGHIYAISVSEDNSMKLLSSYDVVPGQNEIYNYSCLTEMQDGRIALLYESAVSQEEGTISYKTIPFHDIVGDRSAEDTAAQITVTAPGLASVQAKKTASTPAEGYSCSVAYEITLTDVAGAPYTGPATVKLPAAPDMIGCKSYIGSVDGDSFEVAAPVDGFFTVQVPHFSTVTISGSAKAAKQESITVEAGKDITVQQNGLSNRLTNADVQNNGTSIVGVNVNASQVDHPGTTEYTLGEKVSSITSGTQYVIASGESMLVSNGAGKLTNAAKTDQVQPNALWTITKSGNEYTISQVINGAAHYLGYTESYEGNVFSGYTYTYQLALTTSSATWAYQDGGFKKTLTVSESGLFGGSDKSADFYLTPAWSMNTTKQGLDLYTINAQDVGASTTYDHSITFTGKQAGHATVTIGDVIYDVTVKNQKKDVALSIGQKQVFDCAGPITGQPDSRYATASLSNGKLTITGTGAGTTTVIAGGVEYTVKVSDIPLNPNVNETPFIAGTGVGYQDQGTTVNGPVTKLTTSVHLSYDLNLKPEFRNKQVKWSIEDSRIASVDQSGVVTGKAVGETRVIATIDGVAYSIPVVIKDFGAGRNNYRIYNFYAAEITDTTVYYIWNNDSNLIPLIEGEAIYVSQPKSSPDCCNFFGAPNPGYALTRMSSTNSLGHYFLLHTGNHRTIDTTDTGFVNGRVDGAQGAGVNQQANWGSRPGSQLYNSVQTAINAKCDGGMGFTRTTEGAGNADCRLTFRSEKLPTVTKEVIGVLGTDGTSYRDYVEGMTAKTGEQVYYRITVSKYASQDEITYSNVQLEDKLNNSKPSGLVLFQGNGQGRPGSNMENPANITNTIRSDGTRAKNHEYFASYTISDNDLDTTLVNKADLSYNYRSHYSSGAFDASASAEAKITATAFQAQDLVVDFGLPVTVHYNSWGKENVVLNGGSAKYGSVSVSGNRTSGWDVTYTPTQILRGVDTVTLTATNGTQYQFRVFPATTVYYEEGFANLDGFSAGSRGSVKQEAQLIGQKAENFGYTDAYKTVGSSNNSESTSLELNQTATFTFTGTGVELYANADTTSGIAMVTIKDLSTGMLVKFYQIDTRAKSGVTNVTGGQDITAYSLPILSERGLPFGNYEVAIRHVSRTTSDVGGPIRLDGYRIHNTLNDLNNAAYPASEQAPQYAELRDQLLAAVGVTDETDSLYNKAGSILDQVHNASGTTDGVIVLGQNAAYTQEQMKDLLDNGPKNELFLYPNQAVSFNLGSNRAQIGLKAINGTVNYTMNGASYTINTAADMFYHDGTTGEVTITNNSENILSITLIKYFGTAATAFRAVTQDQMVYALRSLGCVEPVVEADAALNVSLVDYTGTELASAPLTANGPEGQTNTFTAAQILEAAEQAMPAGYAPVDAGAVRDVTVAYGENGSVSVQIGKTAVLNITFVTRSFNLGNIFRGGIITETQVGSAALTAVQTSKTKKASFSAQEIRSACPAEFSIKSGAGSQKVPFGGEKDITVVVD